MFRPEKHFSPTFDAAETKFKWIKDFLKATITIERRTTRAAKQVLASFYRLGLITHFPPVFKSAPNRAGRARAPLGCSPDYGRTSRGPTGEPVRFSFDNFKLKCGNYILSESAAWFHFAWGKVALRLSMVILKFPDGAERAEPPHLSGMRSEPGELQLLQHSISD